MNEHELDLALGAIGDSRTRVSAPPVLRANVRAVPLESPSARGPLSRLNWRFLDMFSATKFVVGGVIVALAFSLLIPYVRATAESVGVDGRGGWMGRAERMLLILVGLMAIGLGLNIMEPLLWAFVILTGLTVVQRIRRTWQQLAS